MMRRKKYNPKSLVKDIGAFSLGAITLGAGSLAVAPFPAAHGAGLATASSIMPALGSVMMMKHQVGMMSNVMEYVPPGPALRRRKK